MGRVPGNQPMISGSRVYRIHWVPGTDRLRAVCHCSAEHEFEDPAELWEWLLDHPVGHDTAESDRAPSPATEPVPASVGG